MGRRKRTVVTGRVNGPYVSFFSSLRSRETFAARVSVSLLPSKALSKQTQNSLVRQRSSKLDSIMATQINFSNLKTR